MERTDLKNAAESLERLRGLRGEDDIRSELRQLLHRCGAGDYRLNVRVGAGFADMVCHEYRVLIETKSRGEAGPERQGSALGESQRDQVGRYIEGLAVGRLEIDRPRPWRGFLTDGIRWWGWEWDAASERPAPILTIDALDPSSSVERFQQFVSTHLAPVERHGAAAPPEPLKPLFEPYLTEVKDCLESIETRPFFATKLTLWRQVLRGSGLISEGPLAHTRHFAEHTLLAAAARMIVAAAQGDDSVEQLLEAIADGFCAWLIDFSEGREIASRMATELTGYDWGAADRDLLKGLYHDLIDPEFRKEFGEFYTPDWLAKDLVNLVLTPDLLDLLIDSAAQALGICENGGESISTSSSIFTALRI